MVCISHSAIIALIIPCMHCVHLRCLGRPSRILPGLIFPSCRVLLLFLFHFLVQIHLRIFCIWCHLYFLKWESLFLFESIVVVNLVVLCLMLVAGWIVSILTSPRLNCFRSRSIGLRFLVRGLVSHFWWSGVMCDSLVMLVFILRPGDRLYGGLVPREICLHEHQ